MYDLGLVSVSFRNHSAKEIIQAAKDAGLTCIEWGSDVHAPYDDKKSSEDWRTCRKNAVSGVALTVRIFVWVLPLFVNWRATLMLQKSSVRIFCVYGVRTKAPLNSVMPKSRSFLWSVVKRL